MLAGPLRRRRRLLTALVVWSVATSGAIALAPISQAVDDAHITGTVTDVAGAGIEDIDVSVYFFDPTAEDSWTFGGSEVTDALAPVIHEDVAALMSMA